MRLLGEMISEKNGSILKVVGFKISPEGDFENAGPSAMLISSLRIKIFFWG